MGEYESFLSRLGLNDNECRIYALLLKEGCLGATEIGARTRISRTNTYNVIELLEKKGLVTRSKESGKTGFRAEHPAALNDYIVAKRGSLDACQIQLSSIMDGLVRDYSLAEHKPGVFRFEGRAGLERVHDQLLKDGLDISIIMDRPLFRKVFGAFNDHFVATRLKKKIRTRVITHDREIIKTPDARELREVRYLDHRIFPFQMDLKITARKLAFTTLREDYAVGVMIEDKELARNFMVLFEFLWGAARLIK
jgi:sugar-specific transcriptional regulator TrmB